MDYSTKQPHLPCFCRSPASRAIGASTKQPLLPCFCRSPVFDTVGITYKRFPLGFRRSIRKQHDKGRVSFLHLVLHYFGKPLGPLRGKVFVRFCSEWENWDNRKSIEETGDRSDLRFFVAYSFSAVTFFVSVTDQRPRQKPEARSDLRVLPENCFTQLCLRAGDYWAAGAEAASDFAAGAGAASGFTAAAASFAGSAGRTGPPSGPSTMHFAGQTDWQVPQPMHFE